MDVFVEFKVDSAVSKMEMKGASQQSEAAVIDGFFKMMSGPETEAAVPKEISFSPTIELKTKLDPRTANAEPPSLSEAFDTLKRGAKKLFSGNTEEKNVVPPIKYAGYVPDVGIPLAPITGNVLRPNLDTALDKMLQDSGISHKVKTREPVSRQLPMIGSENRSSFPVEESARLVKKVTPEQPWREPKPDDKPGHWETGIVVGSDGNNRYRCYYWCACGNKGKRYIPLEFDYVYCHSCNAEIDIVPATGFVGDDGIPERDGFGNFFIAR